MDINAFFQALTTFNYWLIIKFCVLVVILFYGVFAAILLKQVWAMGEILNGKTNVLLYFLAMAHFVAIAILFLIGALIL